MGRTRSTVVRGGEVEFEHHQAAAAQVRHDRFGGGDDEAHIGAFIRRKKGSARR